MRNTETHYGGNWLDRLLNAWPLLLDTDSIKPLFEIEYGSNPYSDAVPDLLHLNIRLGTHCRGNMYRNGVFYVRLLAPFGLFFMIRWSGSKTKKAFLQAGAGWKLNGRFALTFRIQSDGTAARGTWGPNVGQAQGWGEGNH